MTTKYTPHSELAGLHYVNEVNAAGQGIDAMTELLENEAPGHPVAIYTRQLLEQLRKDVPIPQEALLVWDAAARWLEGDTDKDFRAALIMTELETIKAPADAEGSKYIGGDYRKRFEHMRQAHQAQAQRQVEIERERDAAKQNAGLWLEAVHDLQGTITRLETTCTALEHRLLSEKRESDLATQLFARLVYAMPDHRWSITDAEQREAAHMVLTTWRDPAAFSTVWRADELFPIVTVEEVLDEDDDVDRS